MGRRSIYPQNCGNAPYCNILPIILYSAFILFITISDHKIYAAPTYDEVLPHSVEMAEFISDVNSCYYNFQRYEEGDRIITNEPCLNCTCHNRMLMCYLKVCPFTKPIGQDCSIEKSPDQCCPVITCPEVPVKLLTSSTTISTTSTTEISIHSNYGCTMENNVFFPDGAQVPSDPEKPCELCYCIRNHTACVIQECTLHVEGCKPVYKDDVCCPVRYDCDYEKELSTVSDVTNFGGLVRSTTLATSIDCRYKGKFHSDGELIVTEKPCEHCYCMHGDIVCAVQDCGKPFHEKDCIPITPPPEQCCPSSYECVNETYTTEASTTLFTKHFDLINTENILPGKTSQLLQTQNNTEPTNFEVYLSTEPVLSESNTYQKFGENWSLVTDKQHTSMENQVDNESVLQYNNNVSETEKKPDDLEKATSSILINVIKFDQKTTISDTIQQSISSSTERQGQLTESTDSIALIPETPSITLVDDDQVTRITSEKPEIPHVKSTYLIDKYESTTVSVLPDNEVLHTSEETEVIDKNNTTFASTKETSISEQTTVHFEDKTEYTTKMSITGGETSTTYKTTNIPDNSIAQTTVIFKDVQNITAPGVTPQGAFNTTEYESVSKFNSVYPDDIESNEVTREFHATEKITEMYPNKLNEFAVDITSTVKPEYSAEKRKPEIQSTTKDDIPVNGLCIEKTTSESIHKFTDSSTEKETVLDSLTSKPDENLVKEPTDDNTSTWQYLNNKIGVTEIETSSKYNYEYTSKSFLDIAFTESTGIPGEGSCLVRGKTYSNFSEIPSKDPCHDRCICMSSIPVCSTVKCPSLQSSAKFKCSVHTEPDACCPIYICEDSVQPTLESNNQVMININQPTEMLTTLLQEFSKYDTTTLAAEDKAQSSSPYDEINRTHYTHNIDTVTISSDKIDTTTDKQNLQGLSNKFNYSDNIDKETFITESVTEYQSTGLKIPGKPESETYATTISPDNQLKETTTRPSVEIQKETALPEIQQTTDFTYNKEGITLQHTKEKISSETQSSTDLYYTSNLSDTIPEKVHSTTSSIIEDSSVLNTIQNIPNETSVSILENVESTLKPTTDDYTNISKDKEAITTLLPDISNNNEEIKVVINVIPSDHQTTSEPVVSGNSETTTISKDKEYLSFVTVKSNPVTNRPEEPTVIIRQQTTTQNVPTDIFALNDRKTTDRSNTLSNTEFFTTRMSDITGHQKSTEFGDKLESTSIYSTFTNKITEEHANKVENSDTTVANHLETNLSASTVEIVNELTNQVSSSTIASDYTTEGVVPTTYQAEPTNTDLTNRIPGDSSVLSTHKDPSSDNQTTKVPYLQNNEQYDTSTVKQITAYPQVRSSTADIASLQLAGNNGSITPHSNNIVPEIFSETSIPEIYSLTPIPEISHLPNKEEKLTEINKTQLVDKFDYPINSHLSENALFTESDNRATLSSLVKQSTPKYKPSLNTEITSESNYHHPEEGNFPSEEEYEDDVFGPGTCRYSGKIYVSAQQIPREDPCDFCFCFRGDIICLQQSCPPPIQGCRQEAIPGFCCPRYECPVPSATGLRFTSSTSAKTSTLPAQFFQDNYRSIAKKTGCSINGYFYRVGEDITIASGPCLQCICGRDGSMKCNPKSCNVEHGMQQMMEEALTFK